MSPYLVGLSHLIARYFTRVHYMPEKTSLGQPPLPLHAACCKRGQLVNSTSYKRVTNVERIAGHVLIDAKVEQLFKMYQHLLYLLRNQLSDTVANTSNGNMGFSTRSILVPIISHSYYCNNCCTIYISCCCEHKTNGSEKCQVNICNLSIDHTQIQMWKLCDMSAELFIDFSTEEGLVRY